MSRGLNTEKLKASLPTGRCKGPRPKLRYQKKAEALAALEAVRKSRPPGAHCEKRVYLCSPPEVPKELACYGWHLTSWKEPHR